MNAGPAGIGTVISKVVLGRDPSLHFVAQLGKQADLSQEAALPRGADRRAAAWQDLVSTQQAAMKDFAPVLDQLKSQGVVTSYSAMPLGDTVFIDVAHGKHDAFVQAIDASKQVALLVNESSEDGHGRMIPTPILGGMHAAGGGNGHGVGDTVASAPLVKDPATGNMVGWNVDKIGANQAWAAGVTGKGITVGVVDTGLDVSNPAVADAWRGTGEGADYNWMDFVGGKPKPYDDGAHGTHTAGTVAGHDKGIEVGVAPDAKLIIAKGLGATSGTDEQLLRSLDWMLAPTDLKGNNPDPRRGADVVSNSWGGEAGDPASMWGGQLYERPLAQLKAAGVVTVFAAGNSGPGVATVGPPGNIKDTITVGATDAEDNVAAFSSRGPVTDIQNHGRGKLQKPDVSAPGVAVPSSIPTHGTFGELAVAAALAKVMGSVPGAADMYPVAGTHGRYFTLDGTSMATPATAGMVALVLSKYPTLDPDQVKQVLMTSAKDLGPKGWDPDYGTGRVDVNAALEAAAKLAGDAQPAPAPAK